MQDAANTTEPMKTLESWIEAIQSLGFGDESGPVANAKACEPAIRTLLDSEGPLWILPANRRHPVLVRKPTSLDWRDYQSKIAEIWAGNGTKREKLDREYNAKMTMAIKHVRFPDAGTFGKLLDENYELHSQVCDLLEMLARDAVHADFLKFARP